MPRRSARRSIPRTPCRSAAWPACISSLATESNCCAASMTQCAPIATTTRFWSCRLISKRSQLNAAGLPQRRFELLERLHARQLAVAIGAGHIEQDCFHSRVTRPQIIHGVHVAHIQAFIGARLHGAERCLEDFSSRLFNSNGSGICDAFEAVGNAAAGEHLLDFPIRVGDHGDAEVLADAAESVARARRNVIPVGRTPRVLDQYFAEA